jgi:hypothetical protein
MKNIILMAVALFFAVAAVAQNRESKISIQPKAGVNISTLSGDFDEFIDSKAGLNIGADVEYRMLPKFALSGGLYYSMQGGKGELNMDDFPYLEMNINAKAKLSYLNMPIMANYYIVKGLAIKTGVQFGFLTSAKIKLSADEGSESIGIKDALKKVDFSIPFGISYEFKRFVLEARYNLGLTNIIKSDTELMDGVINTDNFKSKNRVFQITLGYRIGF